MRVADLLAGFEHACASTLNGSAILLDKPILLLGRDLECDIRLDSADSRRHCCIARVGVSSVVCANGRITAPHVEGHLGLHELTISNFRQGVLGDGVPSGSSIGGGSAWTGQRSPTGSRPPINPNEDDLLKNATSPCR